MVWCVVCWGLGFWGVDGFIKVFMNREGGGGKHTRVEQKRHIVTIHF